MANTDIDQQPVADTIIDVEAFYQDMSKKSARGSLSDREVNEAAQAYVYFQADLPYLSSMIYSSILTESDLTRFRKALTEAFNELDS